MKAFDDALKQEAMPIVRLFLEETEREVERALALWHPINSPHEGYAVILEELDELKAEVWAKGDQRNWEHMAEELEQIAAMCARMFPDVVWAHLKG